MESELMPERRPLLTIAIPTYNRADDLAELLEVLEPQVAQFPQVELLISDNGSTDNTAEVIAATGRLLTTAGGQLRVHRHETNIGADANFAFCYEQAKGHFFWICGDDDRIVPGALAEVISHLQAPNGEPAELDMLYATSYGFRNDWRAERQADPLGRRFHSIRSARTFAKVVSIMFTFISGVIVNKVRLESLPHERPSKFLGTNLVQLSWSLPLLLQHRRSLVLWTRPVAARQGNAHGYELGNVFGEQLAATVRRLLPGRPDLSEPILGLALRRWFPSVLMDLRSSGNSTLGLEQAHTALKRSYGNDLRYWMFTYPALVWPLPAARLYTRLTAALSGLIYVIAIPGFWRKES
jgi:abequosyltransferase